MLATAGTVSDSMLNGLLYTSPQCYAGRDILFAYRNTHVIGTNI